MLSSFIIERKINENGNWQQVHETEDQDWTDINLTNNIDYYYRVRAVYTDPDGISEPSEEAGPITPFAPALIRINPTSINFGEIGIDLPADPQTITISNIGGSDLIINNISINIADFSHDISDFPFTISPGLEQAFEVIFTPSSIGDINAILTVTHNAEGSPAEIILSGTGIVVSISDENDIPTITTLQGNYPNPFNPETTIRFALSIESNIRVDIYNIKGNLVTTLINKKLNPGNYDIVWKGTDGHGRQVSSGVYFYKMQTEEYTSIKRMVLLK